LNIFNKIIGTSKEFELKHQIANSVMLIGIFLGLLSSFFNYTLNLPLITVWTTLGTSFILLVSFYFSRVRRMFYGPVYIAIITSTFIFTPLMWFFNSGSVGGFQYYVFLYLIFSISVIDKKSTVITIVSLIIIMVLALIYIEFKYPELVFQYSSKEERFYDILISYISVLVGVALLFYVYAYQFRKTNSSLIEKNKELEKHKHILEYQNEYINEGISYAQKIQKAVLPSINILNGITEDNFIMYIPKDKISGDFYYFIKKENKIFIAVADSTGHGVPGGFMSMLGITMLEDIINANNFNNAADILNTFRKQVIISLDQENIKTITNDGFDISLSIINTDTMELNYAGANLPLLLIRNNELKFFNPDNMPVGIFISMPSFSNKTFTLQKGDSIYLFTDGIIDQFGGKKNKKFSLNRLQEILLKNSNQAFSIQKERLKKEFRKWRGNLKRTDDVLVLGFKIF